MPIVSGNPIDRFGKLSSGAAQRNAATA